jgi:outer membrane biosynthesis protein TonB
MEATIMKVIGVISTTALLLLFGATLPAFAQEDHHEQDAKPAQHEEQAKPPTQEEHAKPAQQEAQAKPAKQEEQAKPAQQQHAQQTPQAKPVQQQHVQQAKQAKPAQQQHVQQAQQTKPVEQQRVQQVHQTGGAQQQHPQRSAADEQRQRAVPALRLSARGSGRIPDARFQANFGRGHEFRIGSPTLVGGYSRFQYGGFWFGFVQPWPVAWYYTDDVYVDYIDGGYYLINPYYPSDRISISVVI